MERRQTLAVRHPLTSASPSGNEGYWQAPPANIYLQENTYRQTVIDVMQLVHVLKKSVDIEGDGNLDLDASRRYYCGFLREACDKKFCANLAHASK